MSLETFLHSHQIILLHLVLVLNSGFVRRQVKRVVHSLAKHQS